MVRSRDVVEGSARTEGARRATRPDHAAVGEDEHLGADALRRRALRANDRHERCGLPALQRVGDRLEHLFVHS